MQRLQNAAVEISEKHEKLPRTSYIDLSSINTSLDISCSSSIASLNEIAEILKRQSLVAAPKLAVEELLSLGSAIYFLARRLDIIIMDFYLTGKSKPKTTNTPLCFNNQPASSVVTTNDFSSRETTLMNASGTVSRFRLNYLFWRVMK